MKSATNLFRMGKRPNARVDFDSEGLYFSNPKWHTHIVFSNQRPRPNVSIYGPSMRAASRCGGQTGSSLPFRLRQHLRELRIDLTAASVVADAGEEPAVSAGEEERDRLIDVTEEEEAFA